MPIIHYDAIPKRIQLPSGIVEHEVEKMVRRDLEDGRMTVSLTLRVNAPSEFNGMVTEGAIVYHNFYLGTDDDPEGDLPETQRQLYGWRDLVQFFESLNLPAEPDLERQMTNATGNRGLARLAIETDRNNPGKTYTNVKQWFRLGERQPQFDGVTGSTVPRSPAQRTAVPGPRKPAGLTAVRNGRRRNDKHELDADIPF